MLVNEIEYGKVYLYIGVKSYYMYIHPELIKNKYKTQIITCLGLDFKKISQNFTLHGNFKQVDETISNKVKDILKINKQLFPIY